MYYGQTRHSGRGRRTAAYRYAPRGRHGSNAGPGRAAPRGRYESRGGRYEPTALEEWIDRGGRSDLSLVKLGFVAAAVLAGAGPVLLAWGVCKLARWLDRSARSNLSAVRRRHLDAQRRLRRVNRVGRHEPPTPERLLELWAASRESLEGKMVLGAALGDLEAAVDHSHIRDERGEVVGRRPGIRGWIDRNCPSLHNRYKTLMRYKAMADKFRLVAETRPDVEAGSPGPSSSRRPAQKPPAAGTATAVSSVPVPENTGTGPDLVDVVVEALLGPGPAQGSPAGAEAPAQARHSGAARVRALLARCRTLAALDEALWDALGLVRTRRRPQRAA